jgi:chromosome condensin MukBEF MukE localization factor
MTEEVRKAIDRIRKGSLIECSTEAYYSEIRDALFRFALDCVENNDTARMRIALAEVNRLDKEHGYGLSAESPDKLT